LCYFEAPSGEVHRSLAITRRAFIYAHSQTFRETHLDAVKQLNDEFKVPCVCHFATPASVGKLHLKADSKFCNARASAESHALVIEATQIAGVKKGPHPSERGARLQATDQRPLA
jgi:hypothetical protein